MKEDVFCSCLFILFNVLIYIIILDCLPNTNQPLTRRRRFAAGCGFALRSFRRLGGWRSLQRAAADAWPAAVADAG